MNRIFLTIQMCPVTLGSTVQESQLVRCILGPCVLSFLDAEQISSLIKFGRQIGHRIQCEKTEGRHRKCIFFGESSWCWISSFSSNCFLFPAQHFLSRNRSDHWICLKEETATLWQVYSLSCLPAWRSWSLSSSRMTPVT